MQPVPGARLSCTAEIFAESKRVTLEGAELQVPAKTAEYLTISYGKNYKDAKEPRYVTPIALVVSARVSYTQFWKESGNFEKYCKERMKNARKLARSCRRSERKNTDSYSRECVVSGVVQIQAQSICIGVSQIKS